MKIEIGEWKNRKWESNEEKKEFKDKSKNYVIEVENDEELKWFLSTLLRDYRGNSISYNYEKGKEYSDFDEEDHAIGIKIDDSAVIRFMNGGGYEYQAAFGEIDTRRFVGEIINYSNKKNLKILRICYGDNVYNDISNIKIVESDYQLFIDELENEKSYKVKYLYFDAKNKNNNDVEISLPYLTRDSYEREYINLKGNKSIAFISRYQKNMKNLYCLKDENTRIYYHKLLIVKNEYNSYWVDAFRGWHKINGRDLYGEFYYYNDKLVPHMAICKNEETDKIEFYYSYFMERDFKVVKYIDGENIEIYDESFNIVMDVGSKNVKVFFDNNIVNILNVIKTDKLPKDEFNYELQCIINEYFRNLQNRIELKSYDIKRNTNDFFGNVINELDLIRLENENEENFNKVVEIILTNMILKYIIISPEAIERDGQRYERIDTKNNIYRFKQNDNTSLLVELNPRQYYLDFLQEKNAYDNLLNLYYTIECDTSNKFMKYEFLMKQCEVKLQNNSYYFVKDLSRECFGGYIKNFNQLKFIVKNDNSEFGFTIEELLKLTIINSNKYSKIADIIKSMNEDSIENWFINYMQEVDIICECFEDLEEDEIKDLQDMASSVSMNEINEKQEIRKILFENDNSIVDERIVDTVYYMVKGANISIPNFAIMGDPGTGKTTLAEKIARCFINDVPKDEKIVELKTPADLKGEYVGQNQRRIFEILKIATPNKFNNFNCKKIVLLDEAYNLGKDDQFGKEVITILLNILSGDRHELSIEPDANKGETEEDCKIVWSEHITPNIWLSGYKTEMLNMLQRNPGLSSRIQEIILPTPSVEQLFEYLNSLCDDKLRIIVTKEIDKIKSFIGWATRPEYKHTFANYRGIKSFYNGLRTRFLTVNIENTKLIDTQLEKYIIEQEEKLKEYYKAKISEKNKENGNDFVFEVLTDIRDTFESYKGNKKLVADMKNIVDMLFNASKYNKEGMDVPKGALLVGPPGTGKTLIAKVVASELQKKYNESNDKNRRVGFISVSGAELCGYKGEKVKKLFATADDYDSCIIFIDEIDAIGINRMNNGFKQDLTQLLISMDGFEKRKSLFVMAATNAPEILDDALRRPGRFDRIIEVSNLSDENDVVDVLLFYLQKLKFLDTKENKFTCVLKNILNDISTNTYDDIKLKYINDNKELIEFIDDLKKKLYGYSPAQIKNFVNEASILFNEIENKIELIDVDVANELIKKEYPYRRTKESDSELSKFKEDFLEILERDAIGELKNINNANEVFAIKENEGRVSIALHEVGHAILNIMLFDTEPFEKITIQPRGNTLGYVVPKVRQQLITKKQYIKEIQVLLAGRAAEDVFYDGDVSVGASNDIIKATKFAKKMVENFGFSSLGVIAISEINNTYLGAENVSLVSDEYKAKVDAEVNRILNEQYEEVKKIVLDKKELIEKLAKYVFDEIVLNQKLYLTGIEFKQKYDELNGNGSEF